jgi:Carboxypeptidase regulatory-like domain/TonB-dependent Receptor Plug Domain
MKDWLPTTSWARILRFASKLLLTLSLSGLALGQRASITGTVSDQSGRALPDARVTLLNVDQGLQREVTSNTEGAFAVPFLQPGRYVISGQKNGFAVAEIKDVILHVGDTRSVHLELLVGASPVRVEVDGRPQAIETVSSAVGEVVTGDVIRDAPLNGRNVLDLAPLQPGVNPTDDDDTSPGRFNVSGNRSDSVNYLLDGGLNNSLLDNGIVYNPNPDTIAEFRILTSNYPAEFGRNSGGIVSVITKSGSQQFHGSVFDFFRNDALDANSYFNKNNLPLPIPRAPLERNQFGGTLGGPASRAGSNLASRLFFFVGYQGERQIQGIPEHSIAFTPAELSGDFSQANAGSPDPNVASFLRSNPFFQPDPSKQAEAIIDPARINAVATNYIKAGLVPTSSTGQLNTQENATYDADELTGKLDFELNSKDRLAATVGWSRVHVLDPYSFATVPGFADTSDFADWFTTVAYTHIFSPNLLNEARVGFHRNTVDQENPASALPKPNALGIGITPDLPSAPTDLVFDFGALALGSSPLGPSEVANNTFSFLDTLTWIHGRHNWKAGAGFSPFQNNNRYAFYVNGRFDFISSPGIGSQNSLADFLLGIAADFTQSADAASNLRTKFTDAFLQDEWHVTHTLVLTLGTRYEYSTPKRDTEGRTFSIIPGLRSTRFPNAPVGMVFPGDRGAPEGVNFPETNNWAARAGFAWDLSGHGSTSLRGGFGIFYDLLKGEDNLQFNGQPPFYASTGFGFAPISPKLKSPVNYLTDPYGAAGITNPFPSRPPLPDINFGSTGAGFLPIGSSGSVFVVDPHLRTPYTYQYHLSIEQAIGQNTIAEVNYVGSSSHGLTSLIDINPFVLGTDTRILNVEPQTEVGCPNQADPATWCFGALPEFRNVVNASFNSLQSSLRKQFSSSRWFGRSYFTLAYTYAHNIDNASGFRNRNSTVPSYQPDLLRASADMDLRQRLIFSGGWELPFAEIFSTMPKAAVQGWSLFPIIGYHTGFPIDVFGNVASPTDFTTPGPSGAGDPGVVRANLVAPLQIFDPRTSHSFNNSTGTYWFNPNSFSNSDYSAGAPYGTLSRNFIHAPGRVNVNLAFSKTTPLCCERLLLEFRADFFDIFNRAQFTSPNTNISDPQNFGKIQNTYDPRQIQLAIRLSF